MTNEHDEAVDWYLYRSVPRPRRRRSLVSAYLVSRTRDSKVVATIEPLGYFPEAISDHAAVLRGLARRLVVNGEWRTSPSRHHSLVRVIPLRTQQK